MNRLYRNIFLFFLFVNFHSLLVVAQQSEIDSLQQLLKTTPDDTNKVQIYANLTLYTDSVAYVQAGLKLSEKLDYKKGESISLMVIGFYYYGREQHDLALDYLVKAKKIAETEGHKGLLVNIYKFIGFIYRPHEPNIAVEYYNKSLQLCKELKKELAASYLLSALGNVYEGTYGTKTFEGHSALEYYLTSMEIRERLGHPAEIASSYNETSRVYKALGNTEKARELWQKGLVLAEKSGSVDNIVYLSCLIAGDYSHKKQYDKALEYQLKAYNLLKEQKNTDFSLMSSTAKGLALIYSEMNNPKKANEYFRLHFMFNDSSQSRTNSINLASIKQSLSEEREKEHLLLKDAEIEKQKAIVQTQVVLRNAFLVGLALVIILVGFIFIGYRQKQKANYQLELNNRKIEHAYKIIEEKNNALTDSVRYALRIQHATLPNRSDINTAFDQNFVLYKPKDIVSGDFYWFNKSKGKVMIAAVDCTGHGVPGAFMSIIGSERLNDAVQNEADPGKILSMLNKGVKASLRQSEAPESTRDGMDIALCSFAPHTNTLQFAGANRPLWIIRKNSSDIEEIKPNKIAVGGITQSEQCFDTHTLQLQQGDSFYIFSDGYADQFGGQENKKLTTKKFRRLVLSIQDKTMPEQAKALSDFAEQWKGKEEQVDDILVIGVRV